MYNTRNFIEIKKHIQNNYWS